MYLIYVDDSGDDEHDLLSALALPARSWGPCLVRWKTYRRWLNKRYGLTPGMEFHSTEFSRRKTSVVLHDHDRNEQVLVSAPANSRLTFDFAYISALKTIGSFAKTAAEDGAGARIFSLHREAPNGTGNLYPELIGWIDEWLDERDEWGALWYDSGDPAKETALRRAHRDLSADERRLMEDPTCRRSHESHLIQMADVCAHAAYKAIRGHDGRETRPEIANGYRDHLGPLLDLSDDGAAQTGIRGYTAP